MGLAHKILAFFAKKLVVDPIHRHRHMTAAIHESVKLPFVIDNKTFLVGAPDLEQEFF